MGTKIRPFRVAYRVLLAAFVLSLVVIAANPQAVRLAIIAESRAAPVDRQVVSITADPSVPDEDKPVSERSSGKVMDHPAPPEASEAIAAEPAWSEIIASAATHTVSTRSSRTEIASLDAHHRAASTMPVVSPAHLRNLPPQGEYFELPPPPQTDEPLASPSSESASDSGVSVTKESATPPAAQCVETGESLRLVREQLESEIRSLRREVDLLADAQKVGQQLARLEHEQQKILRLHEELPFDRMTKLVELLLVQLQSVRETIPQRSGAATLSRDPTGSAGNDVSPGFATSQASPPEAPLLSPANPPSSRPLSVLPGMHETALTDQRGDFTASSRCATCHPQHVPR